ncbi:MAG: type II CRISPR RNA-guided endonuclease Cas9, partial [Candidatus Izimaplasma sp.]|nr:type II CRISPR RNA-guided endonuclease Cas9 [Candidatus Izimaplasma bacterium]
MEPKKVFVGLDLGTESCGWAVTDQNYNVLKKSGKHLHGVRKFTEAEAAENRRIKRSGRRRLERRKFRINILQDLFNEEIIKKDPNFFIRLNNSFFNLKEKPKELGKYSLFNDKLYTDAQYYKEYKTIFHLRHHLMNSNEKEDIRLIYLACHNILKYRGNFLMKGISPDKKSSDFSYIIEQIQNLNIKLNDFLDDEIYSISVNEKKIEAILDVIKKTNSINDRVNKINKILNKQNDKQNKKIIELFIGKKVQFKDILLDDKYKDIDVPKIKFSEEKYEDDVEPILYELIGDAADAIHTAKKIYNWIMIKNFLKESNFISEAKVIEYNNHHRDLLDFKKFIRNNFDKEIYNDMFRKSEKQANNYVAYVKTNFVNNKKHYVSGCSYEDFLKTTKKLLKSFEERNNIDNKTQNKPSNLNEINWNLYIKIKERVENREFMPKQRVSTNGVLPYQLHLYELNTILDNASKHYKFLNRTDESGLTIKDKIEQLMTFRIPYYIG